MNPPTGIQKQAVRRELCDLHTRPTTGLFNRQRAERKLEAPSLNFCTSADPRQPPPPNVAPVVHPFLSPSVCVCVYVCGAVQYTPTRGYKMGEIVFPKGQKRYLEVSMQTSKTWLRQKFFISQEETFYPPLRLFRKSPFEFYAQRSPERQNLQNKRPSLKQAAVVACIFSPWGTPWGIWTTGPMPTSNQLLTNCLTCEFFLNIQGGGEIDSPIHAFIPKMEVMKR